MADKENEFWFAAKRYGLGWTLPVTWQGWTTVAVYALLLVVLLLLTSHQARLIGIVALTSALIAIIVWKGERPIKWRWGSR